MKKFFISFFIVLGVIGSLPFTSIGQEEVLIPIANAILKERIKDHKVVVKELKPTLDSFEGRFIVDDSIDIFLTGPIEWKSQKFDFKYMINSQEINLDGLKLPLNMDIKGSIVGDPKKLDVYGLGSAFDSTIKYKFKVIDQNISAIELLVKDAKIKEILTLAKQPAFGDGRLTINANIPKIDLKNPEGSAKIKITKGLINKKLIAKMFKVQLPKSDFNFDGKFDIKKKVVVGDFLLSSSMINLRAKKLISTVDFAKVKSDFRLKIPELADFRDIAKQKIKGRLDLDGKLYFQKKSKKIQLSINTKSFGGNSQIFYDTDSIKAKLININVKTLTTKTGLPAVVKSGKLTLNADLKDVKNPKNINGKFSIKSAGAFDRKLLKKLYKFDPLSEKFILSSSGNIKKGLLYSKTRFKNSLLSLALDKTKYSIPKSVLGSKFNLKVVQLSKLKSLIKADLRGALATSGSIVANLKSKKFKVLGLSKSLGGLLKYNYKGNKVALNLKNVNGSKLLYLLKMEPYFVSSVISGYINIQNIKDLAGVFSLSSSGKLNNKILKKKNDINLGSNLPYKLKFKGNIISKKLSSTILLTTPIANLNLKPFNMDTKTKKMIGEYHLKIPELIKLKPITKQKYYGSLVLNGQFWKDKIFHLTGEGKKWQGKIGFRLEGDNLKANVKSAQMVDIFKTLGYTPILIGKANASLKYNLKRKSGKAKITMDKSRLVRNSLVKALDLVIHKDLSKEIFNKAVLDSRLSKDKINFNFDMRSNRHRINIQNGKIDRKKNRIDAIVTIYDDATPYKARLKGSLKKPKIIPILSGVLKRKALKEAERLLRKNGIKVDKIKQKIDKVVPKELQKDLQNTFKGLF
jgi:hypothetical protein